MKVLRKYAPFLAIVMCFSLLFVSCSPVAGPASNNLNAKYSGEEIFQGLFFFQNDIATSIPQLNQVATKINDARAQNAEADLYLNNLAVETTDYINAQYPNFFAELQATMYGGDYYEIQEKITLSSKLIEQAILSSEDYAKIYAVGQEISKDADLVAEIQTLDMTKEEDQQRLEQLLAGVKGMETIETKAAFFAAVLAAVYLVAGAVNTVVAAYYVVAAAAVVTELAVWDVFEESNLQAGNLSDELLVVELSNYFSEN